MSAFGLQIQYQYGTATGEQALATLTLALERAGEEIQDFGKHVFPRLIPVFEDAERQQFSDEGGGPLSGRWADLSARYGAWKARHFPGKPILELTGKLKAALTSSGPNALRRIAKDTFVFGTIGVPWASFHQTGTRWMRARPVFDFGPEVEAKLLKTFQAGIVDALRAANLEATQTAV